MARPPLPPRTDPTEIGRNLAKRQAEHAERAVALSPPLDIPPAPVASDARAAAIRADAARIANNGEAPPVAIHDPSGQYSQRDWLTLEELQALASDETCPNTRSARAMDARPKWVEDAFAGAVALARQRFGEPPRSLPLVCRYPPATATRYLLAADHDGLTALYAWAGWVSRQFQAFAATCPLPSEYASLYMGVVVPTYNALRSDSRCCVECGRVFALRAAGQKRDDELEKARHCPNCYERASERDRVRKTGRKPGPGADITALIASLTEKHTRHYAKCRACRSGRDCEESRLMHLTKDALNRKVEELADQAGS